jgi:signal transduction histidine kinase
MSYQRRLEAPQSPIGDSPSWDQVVANGQEIITDIVESVQAGGVRIDDRYKQLSWTIGGTQALSQLSPADSLRAATTFFDVTVTSLARHVRDQPELLPCFVTAILALSESINRRMRHATLAYTGYLLDRLHEAHLDERRRIARELHDWLGEGLSVALRQLELYEIGSPERPPEPALATALAKEALVEAMRRLRAVTSGLRQEPETSLEKSLIHYIESVAADADVRLRVTGDEVWASPTVIDEVSLIIREALRNALTHGAPQLVLIGVDLSPHELRAWVEDDGRGLAAADYADPFLAGTSGLASMQERAVLIGGRLTLLTALGQGTRVELLVPLPGHLDEQSG